MMYGLLAQTQAQGEMLWQVLLVAAAATLICVGLHYETIRMLIAVLHRYQPSKSRPVLVAVVLALLMAHLIEAAVFALAYHLVVVVPEGAMGRLLGSYDQSFGDSLYFSLSTYTTVGFGDITPQGHVRMLVGVEALAGLVLVTWSASFTFLIMQRIFARDFNLKENAD